LVKLQVKILDYLILNGLGFAGEFGKLLEVFGMPKAAVLD